MSNLVRAAFAVMALGALSAPTYAATAAAPAAPAPVAAAPTPAAAAPAAATAATPAADTVVARVNGVEIHRTDVERELRQLGPQAERVPIQMLYPQLLEKMIATKLVSAQGYSQKLENEPDVKRLLKDAQDQIVAQDYVRKTIQPKITEAKIKEKYDELTSKMKPEEQVRARHILVPTEAEAQDLIKQVKAGGDFAKLATEKSQDKESAKEGGDLGYFSREQMVKPFADTAFGMKPGQMTDKPVKTDFGYHVIKVEDKRTAKPTPPPLSEVHDKIANDIGQKLTDELIKGLEAKAKVERYNPDGTPLKTAAAPAAKTK